MVRNFPRIDARFFMCSVLTATAVTLERLPIQ